VPIRLRAVLAALVGVQADDVIVGDSASHGLHLLARGLRWRDGDEVLAVQGDYPATVLPWLALADRGVHTRLLPAPDGDVTPDALAAVLGPRTLLVALTWVSSFTGRALNIPALAAVCHAAGVLLAVNASHAIGARPVDLIASGADAVTSTGYKWLCGPYGTGFSWLRPQLREQLREPPAYWFAHHAGRPLDQMRSYELRTDLGARAWDRFCPADFLDHLPWTAALELLAQVGVPAIARHDQRLVQHLLDGLDLERYQLLSPAQTPARSTLVVLRPRTEDAGVVHQRLFAAGVNVALREGCLRLSPHLHNTRADLDRALDGLHP
jgi:cysteine desulfurase/selenocysteine lyase